MVNRIQNRNSGYSDNLFAKGTIFSSNSFKPSYSGATALKLDEEYEENNVTTSSLEVDQQQQIETSTQVSSEVLENTSTEIANEEIPFEVNSFENIGSDSKEISINLDEEYTPKLFSDEGSSEELESSSESNEEVESNEHKLFENDNSQDDDFEIPAFLRRQKF